MQVAYLHPRISIVVVHEPDDVYNYSVRYRRVVSANSITHSGSVI